MAGATSIIRSRVAIKTNIEDKDDPTGFWHMDVGIDTLVNDAIQAVQEEKQLKKVLKKVALLDGGKIYTFNIPSTKLSQYEDGIKQKYPTATILNSIPFTEALSAFKAHA